MTDLVGILLSTFSSRGWSIRDTVTSREAGYSFDLVAESETAVVFVSALPAVEVPDRVFDLTAEVASLTLRQVSAKAWEAYLVLVATGLESDTAEPLQDIQRNLDYCRKVVVDGDAILSADDPAAEAASALAFLFPLEVFDEGVLPDVRSLLLSRLAARGIPSELARAMLDGFQEERCDCLNLVRQSLRDGDENNEA